MFSLNGKNLCGWRYPEDMNKESPCDEFIIEENTHCEADSSIRPFGLRVVFDTTCNEKFSRIFAADSADGQELWIKKIQTVIDYIHLWKS